MATQPIWPLLVLIGSVIFLGDVFVRRVQINLDWVALAWAWIAQRVLGRTAPEQQPETMARLRSRKAQVQEDITGRGESSARFEIDENAPQVSGGSPLSDLASPQAKRSGPKKPANKNWPKTHRPKKKVTLHVC